MLAKGSLRQDLYYRLSVVPIDMPPLRQRSEDIPQLAQFFLQQICQQNQIPVPQIDARLTQYLQTYHWPGNIRQLRHCLERMAVLGGRERLTVEDVPAAIDTSAGLESPEVHLPGYVTWSDLERSAVEQALALQQGNRTRTAELLGISVRTLQRKLKQWAPGPTPGGPTA
jgi:DNA-binding NtrC family response regulator